MSHSELAQAQKPQFSLTRHVFHMKMNTFTLSQVHLQEKEVLLQSTFYESNTTKCFLFLSFFSLASSLKGG